ncbi:MAG TPA: hypothetical protein VMW38_11755 [Terriglobia bacterium]|nr:hypothetical protein [Terriglobia bacterium]
MKVEIEINRGTTHLTVNIPESVDKLVEAATELFKAITEKLKEE